MVETLLQILLAYIASVVMLIIIAGGGVTVRVGEVRYGIGTKGLVRWYKS